MEAEAFKALQAPLKAKYKDEPNTALITLTAAGELGNEGVSCSVKTGHQIAAAGLHPATGGDGSLLCSGDMLLEALVACSGVTLRAVATSLAIPVVGGRVTAYGDLDFKGTLGVSKESPVGCILHCLISLYISICSTSILFSHPTRDVFDNMMLKKSDYDLTSTVHPSLMSNLHSSRSWWRDIVLFFSLSRDPC